MSGQVYFGEPWDVPMLEGARRIATPAGACLYCDEPIAVGDQGLMQSCVDSTGSSVRPIHRECSLRMVLGSIAHLERRCSCYVPGAEETDPPEMTRREAAARVLEWTVANGGAP